MASIWAPFCRGAQLSVCCPSYYRLLSNSPVSQGGGELNCFYLPCVHFTVLSLCFDLVLPFLPGMHSLSKLSLASSHGPRKGQQRHHTRTSPWPLLAILSVSGSPCFWASLSHCTINTLRYEDLPLSQDSPALQAWHIVLT